MPHLASSPAARAASLRAGLWGLAGVQALTGLALALTPHRFYTAIADFGPRNVHDLRDMSAFYLASAVVLVAAARRPSWRAPVLALTGLQYGLHALNHVVDVGNSHPSWVGPFDVATLVLLALVIGALFVAAAEADGAR
jgi:hypothetical protein